MYVKTLTLKNFRNHNSLFLTFNEHINVITGDNAVGKTNIVEAIYYLSLARSFRGVEESELIEKGKEKAEVEAVINEGKIKRNIKILIDNTGRRVFLNSKPVSHLSDLTKMVNIALFKPEDVMLFKGLPKKRREFIDINLSKKSPTYFELISKYNKVLKERNEVLKQEKVDEKLLNILTEMLVKLSEPIISYRQLYFKDINDILIKITHALTGTRKQLEIKYIPFVAYDQDFQKTAANAYKHNLESDLKHKATTIGIHREDFSMSLNGKDIAVFGSQGENRIAALALKLALYFLIKDEDKKPIVILDDVMSELDKTHQEKLITFVSKMKQVFITATNLKINGASHYHINKKPKKEGF